MHGYSTPTDEKTSIPVNNAQMKTKKISADEMRINGWNAIRAKIPRSWVKSQDLKKETKINEDKVLAKGNDKCMNITSLIS